MVQRRLVVFNEAGVPVVTNVPFIPKAKIQTLALQALSLPYTTPEDELAIELGLKPSDYYGRPIIEVMMVKAALKAARSGDMADIDPVLDRAIGKPKTSSENVNVNGTYEGFLKTAAELMGVSVPAEAPHVHDAEVVRPEPRGGLDSIS